MPDFDLDYKAPPKTIPYWDLLLPFEKKGPSRLRFLQRRRWKACHERIVRLEERLGLHVATIYEVLPWCYGHKPKSKPKLIDLPGLAAIKAENYAIQKRAIKSKRFYYA